MEVGFFEPHRPYRYGDAQPDASKGVRIPPYLFAGRNISATHVAFGSTRVMATCAIIGEAAGTGAALCVQKKTSPRGIYLRHLEELQEVLLRQDASLIGIPYRDARNLANTAKVTSSSKLKKLAPWQPEQPQNAFVIVRANKSVTLYSGNQPLTGVLSFERDLKPIEPLNLEDHEPDQPVIVWRMRRLNRKPFCFRAYPETEAYSAENVRDGYNRPFGQPHLWVSERVRGGQEEWLELEWEKPVSVSEVLLIFNDDVNEHFNNLHLIPLDFEAMPELVKDYRIEAHVGGEWKTIDRISGNYTRKKVHSLPQPVMTSRLRFVCESTNGVDRAEVFEVRVYSSYFH